MPLRSQPIRTYARIPWIIASCALLSSIANLITGIVVLATYNSGGDIALGILTIVFAVWGMIGSILALAFIRLQNAYNRSQGRFIAQVSHELRTPITSIRMYADTLLLHRFASPEEEDELLQQMDGEIQRLERLTEQILESRSQKSIRELEPVLLQDVLQDALNPFQSAPKNAGRLDVDIDQGLPKVHVDANDFSNAASNLIRNALTHGGPGVVHVTLARAENGRCELIVRDEGKGIDPKMRKKIFEPFVRGENTTESGIPGFGLGLSIVRDFAQKYNATLKVENHPSGGAVFAIGLSPVE